MVVRAAQEWHFVEHVFLEPFKPEVDDWRHKQRNQLRENQTAHDHQTEGAARCGVLAEPERERYCTHSAASVVIMMGRNRSTLAS